jgi:glyoxylase-like metal-dependent hydrolase (beta-lactamase superfamily II)
MLVDENVYLIKGQGIDSNSYLITGDENIIVDTGTGENIETLVAAISAHGIKLKDVDLILSTHCHIDHIGGNEELKKRCNAEIAAHTIDAQYIKSANGEFTRASSHDYGLNPVQVERLIDEGDTIDGFKVIYTPGHTLGSICLYNEDTNALISGDTIFGDGAVGRTDLPGGDFDKLLESIKKLSAYHVEKILPGHGEPALENGNKIIEKAISWVSKHTFE